jgi:hypothetical protein
MPNVKANCTGFRNAEKKAQDKPFIHTSEKNGGKYVILLFAGCKVDGIRLAQAPVKSYFSTEDDLNTITVGEEFWVDPEYQPTT